MAHLSLLKCCETNSVSWPYNMLSGLFLPQAGACTNARQTQRPRGNARGDGAHPHSYPCRRPASPRAVETETFKVIQCKTAKKLHGDVESSAYNVLMS